MSSGGCLSTTDAAFYRVTDPPDPRWIVKESPQVRFKAGDDCTIVEPWDAPINQWAKIWTQQDVRRNIDGMPVKMYECGYLCSGTGWDMVNPTQEKVRRFYTLPGAVPTAIRMFKQC